MGVMRGQMPLVVCVLLGVSGCRHGEDSCYVICQRAEGTGKIDLKTACVANASTLVLIRACGTYRCL